MPMLFVLPIMVYFVNYFEIFCEAFMLQILLFVGSNKFAVDLLHHIYFSLARKENGT